MIKVQRPIWFAIAALLAMPPLACAETDALTLTRIDGTSCGAEWGDYSDEVFRFRSGDGPLLISSDEVERITFHDTEQPVAEGDTVFFLAPSGRLMGKLIGFEGEELIADTLLGDSTRLPLQSLAGIQLVGGVGFPRASEIFQEAIAKRMPGTDILVSRAIKDVTIVHGRLESLDPTGGRFFFGGQSRLLELDKIFGIVLAKGTEIAEPTPITMALSDGSALTIRIVSGDRERLRGTTSVGSTFTIPVNLIRELRFRSDRVMHLGDMTPVAERVEGVLHAPWPWRRNLSVSAQPISLDGAIFDTGLGMHSRSALTYALDGDFELFVATVGLDDRVRPRGSVVFRVHGDDRVLWDSGSMDGRDLARDIRIEVTGVLRLTLEADYADGLDISDHADWGGARLIRPKGTRR